MEICPGREKGAMRPSRGAMTSRALSLARVPARAAITRGMTSRTTNRKANLPGREEDRRQEDHQVSPEAEGTSFLRRSRAGQRYNGCPVFSRIFLWKYLRAYALGLYPFLCHGVLLFISSPITAETRLY